MNNIEQKTENTDWLNIRSKNKINLQAKRLLES